MKAWINAFRLRTLPLAISGWLIGISIASTQSTLNWSIAFLTLLTAVFLQILSNLANDYGDASSGVDEHRTGEARMVSAGLITPEAMKRAMIIFVFLSLISGLLLLYIAFPNDLMSALVLLILGIIGIGAAIKYTVGKNPYGYAGFGDVFVFIFFGLVLVFGTFYLQIQTVDWKVLLPATSMGLFSVGVLNVNNIRDIESDQAAGKQSIPVRIGKEAAIKYHVFLLSAGMLSTVAFVVINQQSWPQFLFVLTTILLQKNIKAVRTKPSEQLDPFLKQMAISTLLFAILFAIGQFSVGSMN